MVASINSRRGSRKKIQTKKTNKPQEVHLLPMSMERMEQLKKDLIAPINLARSEFDGFHERLKELRENRIENKIGFRLKQTEAAFLTDQLPPNYNRVERGLIKPSVDLLIQVSEIFGVTIDFLVKGKYSSHLYIQRDESNEQKGDNKPSGAGILGAYEQIISAKEHQINALNSLVDELRKENKRLQEQR